MQAGAIAARSSCQSLAQYRAALSNALYPITFDLAGSESDFCASFSERRLGMLHLFKVHANGSFECRGYTSLAPDEGYFLLQLQETGGTAYTHRGRHAVCDRDSLILMDPRNRIVGNQFGPADALIVRIPARMLASIVPRADDYCSTAVDAKVGSANILATIMKDVWGWRDALTEHDHEVIPETMLRLIGAVFGHAAAEIGEGYCHKSQQLERLRGVIRSNLSDPGLSVDHLCRLLDLSRTTIFSLTRMIGTTVERLIIDARLEAVETRLGDPVFGEQSITEIAFSAGFQDLSHFGRRFKQRYGETPARYRLNRSFMRRQ